MERRSADLSWCTPSLCRSILIVCYGCALFSLIYDQLNPVTLKATRWLTARAMFASYFLACISLTVQLPGLIGSRGILPVKTSVEYWQMRTYSDAPRLLRLRMRFQIWFWKNATDAQCRLVGWVSVVLALLGIVIADSTVHSNTVLTGTLGLPVVLVSVLEPILAASLYIIYSSLRMITGEFTQLQWDSLLLEVGFYTAVLTCMPGNDYFSTYCIITCIRFVIFKLWFSSGVVKIVSGDINWRNWKAMHYHYLTQPLPNPVAWLAHVAPDFIHHAEVLFTLIGELPVPFLVFFGSTARLICFHIHSLLLCGIMMTGNYGFFQVLCISAQMSYFDDSTAPAWVLQQALYSNSSAVYINVARASSFIVLILALVLSGEPLTNLSRLRLMPYHWISRLNRELGVLIPCHSYGLFAVMTTRRDEIVFEGSRDGQTWQEFELPYKPGIPSRAPSVVPLGHMPRLDWRLWFLPLRRTGPPPPWFSSLIEGILEGSPQIYSLFRHWGTFTPNDPPLMVQCRLYEYGFSKPSWTTAYGIFSRDPVHPNEWWVRRSLRIYYGPFTIKEE